MSYTVKKLSTLSGVSVRTLHFYDEIGLVKPAWCGSNGYRHYEEEQLLMLQQILFFRELGLPLKEIQTILERRDFDKIAMLESHKSVLRQRAEQAQMLIQTIDKTIARIKGTEAMSDKELYLGFDPAKQAEYEQEIIARGGKPAERMVEESRANTKNWKKADYEAVKADYDRIHKTMAELIRLGKKPDDIAVQRLVRDHHAVVNRFYKPTKDVYVGLGKLYVEHAEFRKLYDSYDPRLAEFLAEAITIFAAAEY